jgi:nucleoside-diphosphate-sugar epimerase
LRALVVGGSGFIGVQACRELMRRGVETVAAGRRAQPFGTFTSYVALDRSDPAALSATLESVQPDVLLDLACYVPADVDAVLERFTGRRYVFVSTSAVYPDGSEPRPALEDDYQPLAGPVPAGRALGYAEGKRWCETALARRTDRPWTVLRPPAVFGAGDHTLRIAAYLQRIEDGGPILLPGPYQDDPVGLAWSRDVGYACALACELQKPIERRAYNVAFDPLPLTRVIAGAARATGREPDICAVPADRLPPDASPYGPIQGRPAGLDIGRARAELGFESSALEDALAETLAWYRASHPTHPGYAARPAELDLAAEICGAAGASP